MITNAGNGIGKRNHYLQWKEAATVEISAKVSQNTKDRTIIGPSYAIAKNTKELHITLGCR